MTTTGRRPRALVTGFAAVLAATVMVAAACSSTSPSGSANDAAAPATTTPPKNVYGEVAGPADGTTPTDGGKVVFGIEAEPEGVDPTRYALSSSGHFVASAVFDPLATLDDKGNAVPYLATAIEPSDEYKTWTITVPTGVKFHDGSELTSQVVTDNLEAYRKSLITGPDFAKVASVTTADATHVVMKLSDPMVSLPLLFAARQTGYMIAPAMLASPDLANKPIGTGPFVFSDHTKDKSWSFTKNSSYWKAGLPHLDALEIRPIADNNQRYSDLRAGTLDMMDTQSAQEIVDMRTTTDLKRVENLAGEEHFEALNTSAPPFDDLVARQAVAYATDTAKFIKEIGLDVYGPANGPFAPGQVGYLEKNGYPEFNLEKAKALVKEYTAKTGKPFEFTLHTQADVQIQAESQLLQSGYEAAGMKVTVIPLPQINLIAAIASGNYNMGRFRLFGSPSPDGDASFWRSTSIAPPPGISTNFPRFANQKIDDAVKAALGTNDEKVKNEQYQIVNKEFATNIPYLWLGRAVWALAASPKVNGIYAAKNGSIQTIGPKTWLSDLWLSR